MLRAHAVDTTSHGTDNQTPASDSVRLDSGDRHLRRKVLTLESGEQVLVDLPNAQQLAGGDRLLTEDGRRIVVIAADEDLMEVRAANAMSLIELAWHIGNRHLPAEIHADRILVQRDHVIHDMLAGLGADVREVRAPFQPSRGAYHKHTHRASEHTHASHSHTDRRQHDHTHSHGHNPGHNPRHNHDGVSDHD